MSDLFRYRFRYMPVKYFLSSYRAYADGIFAIEQLEQAINSQQFLRSSWKINWIAACSILRTAIDLFRKDAKSCVDKRLRSEIAAEWQVISERRDQHSIFWEFLRKERDAIMHDYDWSAYEAWIDENGEQSAPPLSLLAVRPSNAKTVLLMRSGMYKGRDSLELLRESADWVHERICYAINRAGYEPDEERNMHTFAARPPKDLTPTAGLLSSIEPIETCKTD